MRDFREGGVLSKVGLRRWSRGWARCVCPWQIGGNDFKVLNVQLLVTQSQFSSGEVQSTSQRSHSQFHSAALAYL